MTREVIRPRDCGNNEFAKEVTSWSTPPAAVHPMRKPATGTIHTVRTK